MIDRSVLFVGFDPARMSLAAAPAGTAEHIQAGIDHSMRELAEAGYEASYCALAEDDPGAEQVVRAALSERSFACVVIGAGLRLLPQHTTLFEALIRAVTEDAPSARLAFNATPADAAEAVRRQLGSDSHEGTSEFPSKTRTLSCDAALNPSRPDPCR